MPKALIFAFILFTAFPASAQRITTFAGSGVWGYSGDGGPATLATFTTLSSVASDGFGNVYIVDQGTNNVRVVRESGILSNFAGTGVSGYSGDGGPATMATFSGTTGVATDFVGNVYIVDAGNRAIRKVSPSGIIITIAGTGSGGSTGDGGPATLATMESPTKVAVDPSGNIYICETYGYRIRKVNGAGIISTIAGTGIAGYSGDGGPATLAKIEPNDIAVDANGNVYISIVGRAVRKITPAGIITTFAGGTAGGYSGDGGPATAALLGSTKAVAVDGLGNVYISDNSYHLVRKVNTAGIISTFAGSYSSSSSYSGDGGPATAAGMNVPLSLAIRNRGNLYIADFWNYAIREVIINRKPVFTGGTSQGFAICQGSPSFSINSLMAVHDSDVAQPLRWTVATAPLHGTLAGIPATATTTGAVVTPAGMAYTAAAGFTGLDTFVIQITDSGSASKTQVIVTVNPLPAVTPIVGGSTVCTGSTLTLTDATSGGWWSVTSPTASVSAGVVTGLSSGTNIVSYTFTNVCGSATTTKAITVNTTPYPGVITGPSVVCNGSSITLTPTIAGGTWSATNGSASVAGGVITTHYGGIDTIIYGVTLGACTGKVNHIVNIDVVPLPATITGLDFVCIGTTIPLAASQPGIWSCSNTNASINSVGVVTGLVPGTSTAVHTVTNFCGSVSATHAITIDAAPTTAGAITGDLLVCVGHTKTLGFTVSGGSWSSASFSKATIGAATGVVYGNSAGTVRISYTVYNGCGSMLTSVVLTVVAAVDCATRIEDTPGENVTFAISPNPSAGTFTIRLPSGIQLPYDIIVTDITGKQVYSSSETKATLELDLAASVGPGVYFIAVISGDKRWNERAVVIPGS